MLGEILHGSLMFLYVLWEDSLTQFSFTLCYDHRKYRGKICLLSCIIKKISLFRANIGQDCLQPPCKDWSFLSLGFLSCDVNVLLTQYPPGPTSVLSLWGLVGAGQGVNCKCETHTVCYAKSNKTLYLWPKVSCLLSLPMKM